jgi:hypothetical protein
MTPVPRGDALTLSMEERRELEETAQLFELIVETAPELSALETLREIYARLDRADKLGTVLARISELIGSPAGEGRADGDASGASNGCPEPAAIASASTRAARAEEELESIPPREPVATAPGLDAVPVGAALEFPPADEPVSPRPEIAPPAWAAASDPAALDGAPRPDSLAPAAEVVPLVPSPV